MVQHYIIQSEQGDEYKLRMTSENTCDFIHLVPTKKNIPVQEYRSRLFTAMFNRYVKLHRLNGFCNHVVKIEGVAEPFYFHVIYRKEHEALAKMISDGNQKDFSKPEE